MACLTDSQKTDYFTQAAILQKQKSIGLPGKWIWRGRVFGDDGGIQQEIRKNDRSNGWSVRHEFPVDFGVGDIYSFYTRREPAS